MSSLTFALDAMSGDFGPRQVVPPALQILEKNPNIIFFMVGDVPQIQSLIPASFAHRSRLHLIPAATVVTQDMTFSQALKISEQSSMRIALALVQSGKAKACISAGNTAALMGLSVLFLKSLPGVLRPALVTLLPNQKRQKTVMLDLGANSECSETMLMQFALMGVVFAQKMLSIEEPKIALLNMGKEVAKGKELVKNVAHQLKENAFFNFNGYVEGNEILSGQNQVILCDGFSGNIALKTMEGTARFFIDQFKDLSNSFFARCFLFLMKKRIAKAFGDFDPNGYNGATLLGLQGIVVKSHGAANEAAFCSAIEHAIQMVESNILHQIESDLLLKCLHKKQN